MMYAIWWGDRRGRGEKGGEGEKGEGGGRRGGRGRRGREEGEGGGRGGSVNLASHCNLLYVYPFPPLLQTFYAFSLT